GSVSDPSLAGYIAMRQAQRAVEAGEAALAIALADSAARHSRLPPRVRVLALVRAAQAYALQGDAKAVNLHLTRAYQTLERCASTEPDEALAAHCATGYVRAHE